MPKTVTAMVEGGKATAGPPLGPALGPLGVKIPDIISKINQKTKDLSGMQVPIKVIVNDDKTFDVEVGTPPVSALIKKELKIQSGSKEPGKVRAGDLSEDQIRKVARMKFGSDDKSFFTQVSGTARSMGVSVGKGAVTKEELKVYEEAKAAEAAAEAAKAAAAPVAAPPAEAAKTEPATAKPTAKPGKK